jgi:hypothetical protein
MRKLVHPRARKYSASRFGRNSFIDSNVPAHQEGRIAIVTDVGQGMRWTRQRQAQIFARTNDAATYGEVVWSWRSDAGAKVAGLNESGDRRWQPSMVTEEITYKP